MARPRDPRRDEAKKIWIDSNKEMKLVDIAEKLEVSASTIRKWKSQDKWDNENKRSAPNAKGSAPNRIGAPKGNRNAKGNKGGGAPKGNSNAVGNIGGAPPIGNRNAVTTGEHESIMWDYLDEDEKELFGVIKTDPVYQLDITIRELTLRQRRMMKRIQAIEQGLSEKERRVLQQLKKVKEVHPVYDAKSEENKNVTITKEKMVTVEVEETEFRKLEDVLNIEEALTRVTDKLLKAIKQKHEIERSYLEQPLKVEQMRANVERTKAEVKKMTGSTDGGPIEILIKRKGEGR